jgi:hypothetical protein
MRGIIILLFITLGLGPTAFAGKKIKILFIGNSYTYVNNMPQIVADIATSMGDTLVWDMEAPGGYTFSAHWTANPATLSKIKQGGWNYVVLQDQSQEPALPPALVNTDMFPYARKLDSFFNLNNPCGETIFYMTWGRKNGDISSCSTYAPAWPYFCTYESMDSIIRVRYRMMADSNQCIVSPVGAVRHYIRINYPSIELYDADESHPSPAGSYAAACAFYSTIFKKDPTLITFNYSISSTDAANIKTAAKKVVYDSMSYWHIGQYKTEAGFTYSISGNTVSFTNTSLNYNISTWYFGDGKSSNVHSPFHNYGTGTYTVMYVAHNISSGCDDTTYSKISLFPTNVGSGSNDNNRFEMMPNPVQEILTISSPLFNTSTYTIRIQNQLGQTVYCNTTDTQPEQHINLTEQNAGVYVISITTEGKCVYLNKLVKL